MEKVTLDKETARQLLAVQKLGFSNEQILECRLQKRFSPVNYSKLNEVDVVKLALSLYVGFDVEKSKEDMLVEMYQGYEERGIASKDGEEQRYCHYVCQGIRLTLDTLGLKIQGINE